MRESKYTSYDGRTGGNDERPLPPGLEEDEELILREALMNVAQLPVIRTLFDTCAGIRAAGENHLAPQLIPGGTLTRAEASCQRILGAVKRR